jgi:SAM-dependent methyltransferase
MKTFIKKLIRFISSPFILADYFKFCRTNDKRFKLSPRDFYPCLRDKTFKTGFDAHYVYHTSWAARKVKEINPAVHTDISSSLYFSGIISAFVPVDFYDYRPADLQLSNLKSNAADLTKLAFADDSLNSLSCMHTVEHIGLGRYGDPIDSAGDLKAINELKRVLAPGGSLLFVVPVGQPKIEYNAHRIYSYEMIKDYFKGLALIEFSLVDDSGRFIENANPDLVKNQAYGCGCFWFKK